MVLKIGKKYKLQPQEEWMLQSLGYFDDDCHFSAHKTASLRTNLRGAYLRKLGACYRIRENKPL